MVRSFAIRSHLAACWLLATPLLWSAPLAHADPAPDARAYLQHREAGQRLFSAGEYEQAIREFQAAYELDPGPRLLFTIGLSYRKLGQPREALAAFERCRREQRQLDNELAARLQEEVAAALQLLDEERDARAAPLAGLDPPPALPAADEGPALARARAAALEPALARPRSGRYSPGRRAAAFALGGLLVASLTTAIVLTALDGQMTTVTEVPLVYEARRDYAPGYGTAYAAAGLLAGGLVLTLALPPRHTER